jgi:hypothetical protein
MADYTLSKKLDSLPDSTKRNLSSLGKGIFLVGSYLVLRLFFAVTSSYIGSLFYFKAKVVGFESSFSDNAIWDEARVFWVYLFFRAFLFVFPVVILWRIRLLKMTSDEYIQLGALVCLAHTTGAILPGGLFNDGIGLAFTHLGFPYGSILVLGGVFYLFNLYLITVIARGMGNFVSNTSFPYFFLGSLVAGMVTLPSLLVITEIGLLFLTSLICFVPKKSLKSRRFNSQPLHLVLFYSTLVVFVIGLVARLEFEIQ